MKKLVKIFLLMFVFTGCAKLEKKPFTRGVAADQNQEMDFDKQEDGVRESATDSTFTDENLEKFLKVKSVYALKPVKLEKTKEGRDGLTDFEIRLRSAPFIFYQCNSNFQSQPLNSYSLQQLLAGEELEATIKLSDISIGINCFGFDVKYVYQGKEKTTWSATYKPVSLKELVPGAPLSLEFKFKLKGHKYNLTLEVRKADKEALKEWVSQELDKRTH